MNTQPRHVMEFTTRPGCPDELYCPTCGRRLLITWSPFSKIVLSPGDESAWHSATGGGVKISVVDVTIDVRLDDIGAALDAMGFEGLWEWDQDAEQGK